MTLSYLDLPAATIDLLWTGPNEPVAVSKAVAWADAAVALGFTDDAILAFYALDDSEGHECAALVRDALLAVGAWRETELGRVALARDVLFQSLIDNRVAIGVVASYAVPIARYLGDFKDTPAAQRERDALHFIDDRLDYALRGEGRGWLAKEGLDCDNPRLWILRQLTEAGIIGADGKLIPATWGNVSSAP